MWGLEVFMCMQAKVSKQGCEERCTPRKIDLVKFLGAAKHAITEVCERVADASVTVTVVGNVSRS